MGVPNTFASQSGSIPLSQLDTNFATPVIIGNTSISLGQTVGGLGNVTITNQTVTNYTESVVTIGNSSTATTIALDNGTVQTVTMTGNCTFTMPTLVAGKSFILFVNSGSGGYTGTFTSVKWSSGSAPTLTASASKTDILTFACDGSYWYGVYSQNF